VLSAWYIWRLHIFFGRALHSKEFPRFSPRWEEHYGHWSFTDKRAKAYAPQRLLLTASPHTI
jgi:hypothetical protein